ncbi:ankyrin repeat-containing domain protein [Hypoxylon crocopeplum]|nr:ankyrin repeat-containing domain protein [Hypoxylon crocopeplum]
MDPLSVIAGITGIIGFTTATAQQLIEIISDIRDAPTEITQLGDELKNLNMVLQSTQAVFQGQSFKPQDVILLQSVEQCMVSCKDHVSALLSVLGPLSTLSFGGGIRDKALIMWRWRQRKTEIRAQQGRLREAKASLNLIVSVCNGYLTGKGHAEIQHEIERLYKQHSKDFISPDGARGFRQRLEDDLRSVTAASRPSSAAGQTDGDYAMNIFMQQLDEAEAPVDDPTMDISPINRPTLLNAVANGNSNRVLELAVKGASFTDRYSNGLTMLHHCALYDEPQIATIALDHGANINSKDTKERLTSFQLAMREESWSVAQLLVGRGCSLGGFNSEQLLGLLRKHSGDLSSMKDLVKTLSERLNNSESDHDIVSEAVDKNDFRALQLLLEAGFDPNIEEPQTKIMPIHRAILFQHLVCLRLLVQHGANTNAFLHPSIHPFLQRENKCHDAMRERVLPGGVTPLTLATNIANEINVSMTKLLLEYGADPEYVFEIRNTTVVVTVCAPYYWSHAKVIIEAGANVNYVCDKTDNSNALYWAIICSNQELVELLLDHGAELNTPHPLHPLHNSINQGLENMTALLVNRGADLTVKDKQGRTPLERAEQLGQHLVVETIQNASRRLQSIEHS